MGKGIVTGNWEKLVEDTSDITPQEKFTLANVWHINELYIMPLTSEDWQEESQDTVPQYLPQGSNTQYTPSGMKEETV